MDANETTAQVETPITESVPVPGDAVRPEETGSAQAEGGAGGEETGASQLAEGQLPTASDDSNATNDDGEPYSYLGQYLGLSRVRKTLEMILTTKIKVCSNVLGVTTKF
jgi:hypothetical protein